MKKYLIKLFPYDKLLHFIFVGILPTLVLLNFLNWWIILIIISVVAVIIEIVDKTTKKGNAEIMDIIYALIGYLIVLINYII